MATSLDMSLDEMIKSRSKSDRGRGRGKARRGQTRGRGAAMSSGSTAGVLSKGSLRVNTRSSAYAIAKPFSRAKNIAWQRDLLEDSLAAAGYSGIGNGTKLYVSNLDAGVTNEDIKELFSEIGQLKHYTLHYDKNGRPSGSAEVVFAKSADALAAMKRYNNVLLDGKYMKIEIIGTGSGIPVSARVNVTGGAKGRGKRTVVMTPRLGPAKASMPLNQGLKLAVVCMETSTMAEEAEMGEEAEMAEEAGMFNVTQTIGSVLCCKCGIPMVPNAANMCVKCLRSEVDITEGLQKHIIIMWCPECQSFLQPPKTWIKAQLESRELLTFCVKRLKNMSKVNLKDAGFVWTEPHSKRIKVKLKVEKKVLSGAILEQAYIAEFVITDHMCESCTRVQANPDQWVAAVQLRQHVSHRRTFFYLEQLILKHDAAVRAIKIKQMDEGIDFFFSNRSHALKFMDFVGKVVPTKSRSDKQLVSHDTKSNTCNYKYTFSTEICPICREDLVCLPPKVANSLGNLGPLVICAKVSDNILLLDPFTLRHAFMDADQYWRVPFKPLLTCKQLVEYVILDVGEVVQEISFAGSRYALADVEVARVSDFGKNDNKFIVRTHIGHLLNTGDYALGYDLYRANTNNDELDKYKNLVIPDAVLIKKSYEEKRLKKRGKPRAWKLKSMNMEVDDSARRLNGDKMNSEYEEFLKDLEENPELRFNISLYRNKDYQPSEMGSVTDGEEVPSVPLDELLADLDISDEEDEEESMIE